MDDDTAVGDVENDPENRSAESEGNTVKESQESQGKTDTQVGAQEIEEYSNDGEEIPAALQNRQFDASFDAIARNPRRGTERRILFPLRPHYVVYKCDPSGSLHNDELVLLLVIKQPELSLATANSRMPLYLQQGCQKKLVRNAFGMLIAAEDTYLWSLDGQTKEIWPVDGGRAYPTTGVELADILVDVAKSNRGR